MNVYTKVTLDITNKETLAAIQEVEEMKKNLSAHKCYTDVDGMIVDLLE